MLTKAKAISRIPKTTTAAAAQAISSTKWQTKQDGHRKQCQHILQHQHQQQQQQQRNVQQRWLHTRSLVCVYIVIAIFGNIMTATLASFEQRLLPQYTAQQYMDIDAYYINNSLLMELENGSMEQQQQQQLQQLSSSFNYTIHDDAFYLHDNNEDDVLGSNQSILLYDNFSSYNYTEVNVGSEQVEDDGVALFMLAKVVILVMVLGLMILVTVVGNVIVIAAIILERNLQNVANYLVVSLAVADLFVAGLVMPLGAVYEINDGWILGAELCDIWTACDVLCCTASILHLVAIAADRFWTVTNIDYSNIRTPGRVFTMIFLVWFTSLIVSLAPQFGWKDPDYMTRIDQHICMVSQSLSYQIFATFCTFYVPLLVILFLYWKIYKIARKRIQRRAQRSMHTIDTKNQADVSAGRRRQHLKICFGKRASSEVLTSAAVDTTQAKFAQLIVTREETEFSTSNYENRSHAGTEITTVSSETEDQRTPNAAEILTLSEKVSGTPDSGISPATPQQHQLTLPAHTTTPLLHVTQHQPLSILANPHHKLAKRRQMLEAKRERKAAQTLAIITGAFVVCWLPFFVMALLLPLCKTCEINPTMASFILWLGYFNSTLNPIIYTIFNPEFRRAFQRILCGRRQQGVGRCRSAKI